MMFITSKMPKSKKKQSKKKNASPAKPEPKSPNGAKVANSSKGIKSALGLNLSFRKKKSKPESDPRRESATSNAPTSPSVPQDTHVAQLPPSVPHDTHVAQLPPCSSDDRTEAVLPVTAPTTRATPASPADTALATETDSDRRDEDIAHSSGASEQPVTFTHEDAVNSRQDDAGLEYVRRTRERSFDATGDSSNPGLDTTTGESDFRRFSASRRSDTSIPVVRKGNTDLEFSTGRSISTFDISRNDSPMTNGPFLNTSKTYDTSLEASRNGDSIGEGDDKGALRRKPSFIKRKINELLNGSLRRSLSFGKNLNPTAPAPAPTPAPSPLTPAKKHHSWYNSLTSLREEGGAGEQQPAKERGSATKEVVVRSNSLFVRRADGQSWPGEAASQSCPPGARVYRRDEKALLRGAAESLSTGDNKLDAPATPHASSVQLARVDSGCHGLTKRYRLHASSGDIAHAQQKGLHVLSSGPGRSRSLTSIDALDPGMMIKGQPEVDSRGELDASDRLIVPPPSAPEVTPSHRRQKLARSQVSSSEYFSVSFEVGDDPGPDEFIPATKGVFLADSLSGVCARRSIDLNNVSVYLDVSNTPLPLWTTEASWLGGRHLRIKCREEKVARGGTGKPAPVALRKVNSGSYRGKSGRFFSSSTEDPGYTEAVSLPSHEGSFKAGSKASKQRWSGLFGNNKDTKMEALVEQLNHYGKHGIPQPAPRHDLDIEDGLYDLEEDWQGIVDGSAEMNDKLRQQQTAIWELIQTEAAYIRTLRVITNLFVACLSSLQASSILTEVDKARLFSNITEIYSANRHFWLQYVLPMLTAARETRQAFDPRLLREGFIKFDEIFEPYTKYCAEQSQCQHYCREKHQENELFTAYLVWCETQKDCNRLRLMDIVVKPMQRLTKYSLLLKAIHKNTESEDTRASLAFMSVRVDSFVYSVNTTLRMRQDYERLRGIIARIEAYDVVETKDDEVEKLLRVHSDLDLNSVMPGCQTSQRRHLILESDLKLKDHATSKMDVHCFLFTDMLLVTKVTTKKSGHEGRVKVIRQPYNVSRLVTHELIRDPPTLALVYLNEYGTATAGFTLSASEAKLVKSWSDGLRKAQDQYATARLASAPVQTAVSRQPSSTSCYYDDENDVDAEGDADSHSCASLNMAGGGLVLTRSPRGGSSRGSRVSSLAHSHSGSMEMEASSLSSRGISVEQDLRGSSLSSDEGLPALGPSDPSKPPPPLSPVPPRRSLLLKSPSPNTLSIQVPIFSNLGQSLPNLTLAATPHPPTPPTSLLLVPSNNKSTHHGLLSPGHRGVSYPPPSPPRGSLRRAFAIPQSRNPPLIKTRNVVSTVGLAAKLHTTPVASFDFDVPVIAGISPPSEEGATPETAEGGSLLEPRHSSVKRLSRAGSDTRRYHTAGVVDELKKQENRDANLLKRLSWNNSTSGALCRDRLSTSCVSADSMHSSSGVSSTESGQFGSNGGGVEGLLGASQDEAPAVGEDEQSCCYDLPHLPHTSHTLQAINMEVIKSCSVAEPSLQLRREEEGRDVATQPHTKDNLTGSSVNASNV